MISAQAADKPPVAHAISCFDTTSVAPSIPSFVYLRVTAKESTDSIAGRMADVFAQSVAIRLRSLLNAKGDTVPPGEPAITWRKIGDHIPLTVILYPNAAPAFRRLSPHKDSVAAATLLDAVHQTVEEGEGPFWPAGTSGDSLIFGFSFERTNFRESTLSTPGRIAFPLFSILFPPEEPVRHIGKSQPPYPDREQSEGVTAVVIAQYLVDSTGHEIPESFKDIRPPTDITPAQRAAYIAFRESIRRWLPTDKFEPAHIAGCPVRQLIQQPFTFSIRGRP
jgi:hypothetical protein